MLCFLYCILASKHPAATNPKRVNKYKEYLKELNYKDIEMPMAVTDIDKFEKMNDLIINVYSCNEDVTEICPSRISIDQINNPKLRI